MYMIDFIHQVLLLLASMVLPKRTSFDYFASLFTNIPLQEIIDIAINFILNNNPNLNITKKELKRLFLFAASQTHFLISGKFYNQVDGVAMGSPLDSCSCQYFYQYLRI